MKILKYVSLLFIAFAFIMGCSGNSGKLRTQPESESKAIQQELNDNWSDYEIKYTNLIIVFDPKNDDKKILVGNYWRTVKDHETWAQLVNGNERLPWGYYNQVWGSEIREIWLSDNQFYGYVTHRPNQLISVQTVNENTVRIFNSRNDDRRNY